jgi:hypothetical protein
MVVALTTSFTPIAAKPRDSRLGIFSRTSDRFGLFNPHSPDDGLFPQRSQRFRYRRQQLMLDRARRSWRTRRVNQKTRLDFDRRLMVQFRGCVVTSDAGLLAHRELDDALGLSAMAGEMLADARTGKNGRHALVGLLRQSVFGRFAGYDDVNDAERLRHDPAMRWIVGGKAAQGSAASPSQMGRFETQWLAAPRNLAALADLSGQWRLPAQAPGRATAERGASVPCQLHLSGWKLEQAALGDRQGRASFIRASGSSSPTCRARPSGSSPSTTSVAHANSGSRKARVRSSGRGCRAAHSPPTRFGSSFMRSPNPIAAKALSRGDALAAPAGRADDFSWPRPRRWRKQHARYRAPTDRIEPAAPSKKADEAKKPGRRWQG